MATTKSVWLLRLIIMHLSVSFCSGSFTQREDIKPASPGVLQMFKEILSDLSVDAHSYIVSLVGKQAVDTSLQCIRGVVKSLSAGVANILNVAFQYGSDVLSAAGIKGNLSTVSPEGVLFVTQWALLAVVGYWLLSLLFGLVAGLMRRIIWLIKMAGALALFGLIVSDTDASLETTAFRLACLVLACVLLGVGPDMGQQGHTNRHLEEEVRHLERRLREMERRRKHE